MAVCGCPSAHTGRLWLSVCVRQHTQDIRGCPSVHISARWSLDSAHWPFPWTVRVILAHVGCLFSTQRTSVGVGKHTHDIRVCPSAHTRHLWVSVSTHDVCGCPSAHTGHPWLSVCVRVYPSAHTGRPWLSISTHISMLVLGLNMLTLPVDCSGDFGPRGLSVQYTQDVRGCPSAHTGRPWVSVSIHRTSCVCWRTPTDVLCVLNRQPTWAKITQTVPGKGQRAESKDQHADMCTDGQPLTSCVC